MMFHQGDATVRVVPWSSGFVYRKVHGAVVTVQSSIGGRIAASDGFPSSRLSFFSFHSATSALWESRFIDLRHRVQEASPMAHGVVAV